MKSSDSSLQSHCARMRMASALRLIHEQQAVGSLSRFLCMYLTS